MRFIFVDFQRQMELFASNIPFSRNPYMLKGGRINYNLLAFLGVIAPQLIDLHTYITKTNNANLYTANQQGTPTGYM